jgi:hypothetical protein
MRLWQYGRLGYSRGSHLWMGLARVSWTSKSKRLVVFADLMTMAESAPRPWPATAITLSPMGMTPASAAMRVTSKQTFMPAQKRRSRFATRSPVDGT